ncbi:hypothetical protein KY326_02400 [Candidatus Woesearchaeota archaeon]|nr:hypothetical protein [Candidatus Woesearchaeota archaeon]
MIAQITKNPAIDLALDTIKIKKQALVFVNSKRSAEKTAEDIAKAIKQTAPEYEKLSHDLLHAISRPTKQCERLAYCAKKGVVFHHAGLLAKQREIIENSFRSGLIKIICCTPTLAYGVDTPAFRAIVKDIKRYTGRGMNYIPVMEYHQICGRCGRPGKEDFGEAITIVGSPKEQDKIVKDYIFGDPEPILSKLAVEPVLRFSLLSLIATDFTPTIKDTFEFFSRTFWAYQFQDMDKIHEIILRMLNELNEFEFINIEGKKKESTKKKTKQKAESDFVSADELYEEDVGLDAKLEPTLLGKRIAELYIDPLTAYKYIVDMKKAAKRKKITDLALIFMICSALELRPMLSVKQSEFDRISVELSSSEQELFEKMPEIYEDEYYDVLSRFKTSLLLKAWIEEKSEDYILKEFNIRPGELHVKVNNADWLIYSADELCRILNLSPLKKELKRLRMRVKYGAKAELLTLIQLENIGRVRARKLYRAGLTDLGKLKKVDIDTLSRILGRKVAISVKEQLGQKVQEKVKDYKEGQQLLV